MCTVRGSRFNVQASWSTRLSAPRLEKAVGERPRWNRTTPSVETLTAKLDLRTKPFLCSGREPSPRPSPFRKGRGSPLASVWSGSLNSDLSTSAAKHSLSPSDGERAGVRGFIDCMDTAKPPPARLSFPQNVRARGIWRSAVRVVPSAELAGAPPGCGAGAA